MRVKCSLIQRRVNIYPLLTAPPPQYLPLGFKTKCGWNCRWISCGSYSQELWLLAGGVVDGWINLSNLWAVKPWSVAITWGSRSILVSWLHIASHSSDRCPAMTLSQRRDWVRGGDGLCKFLRTPGGNSQSKAVSAWLSCMKGSIF